MALFDWPSPLGVLRSGVPLALVEPDVVANYPGGQDVLADRSPAGAGADGVLNWAKTPAADFRLLA
jgi:hypothetical protein